MNAEVDERLFVRRITPNSFATIDFAIFDAFVCYAIVVRIDSHAAEIAYVADSSRVNNALRLCGFNVTVNARVACGFPAIYLIWNKIVDRAIFGARVADLIAFRFILVREIDVDLAIDAGIVTSWFTTLSAA